MHTSCYLIINQGQVMGYMMLSFKPGMIDIVRLCILPPYRHQGYAFQTMYDLIHDPHYRGTIFTLNVSVINHVASHLYTKLGFKPYATLKHYYRDESDAQCMYFDTRYLTIFAVLV